MSFAAILLTVNSLLLAAVAWFVARYIEGISEDLCRLRATIEGLSLSVARHGEQLRIFESHMVRAREGGGVF